MLMNYRIDYHHIFMLSSYPFNVVRVYISCLCLVVLVSFCNAQLNG
uniref:Uncharacterized protein n=1 Tax=Arundo donax TaxID=35708 RepID=A0A0A9DNT3_ARUDO